MRAVHDHEIHQETVVETLPPGHQLQPLGALRDCLPLHLTFAGLLVVWPLLTGVQSPWWIWWGVAWFVGIGVWATTQEWTVARAS